MLRLGLSLTFLVLFSPPPFVSGSLYELFGSSSFDVSSSPTLAPSVLASKFEDLGNCTCNLNRGQCDPLCCCDEECQGISFATCNSGQPPAVNCKGCGSCVLNGIRLKPPCRTDRVCVGNSVFGGFDTESYKALYGFLPEVVSADDSDFLSSQLCVSFVNNPSQGLFLSPDGTSVTGATFSDVTDLTGNDFTSEWNYRAKTIFEYSGVSVVPTEKNLYEVGDTIVASLNGAIYPFFLPSGSSNGACNRNVQVPFFSQLPVESSCIISVQSANIASACDLLGVQTVLNQSILPYPSASLVEGLPPSVVDTVQILSNGSHVHNAVSTSSFLVNRTCHQAVLEVKYLVYHAGGIITRVDAIVTVGDVLGAGEDAMLTYEQRYVAQFLSASVSSPDDVDLLSGNPGYVASLPIRSSNASSEGAIALDHDGLQVTGTDAVGRCKGFPSGAVGTTVLFEQDMLTGCHVDLSMDELRSQCLSNTLNSRLLQLIVPSAFSIGRYGSALPSHRGDWIQFDIPETVEAGSCSKASNGNFDCPATTWVEESLTCQGVVTLMSVEFLTAAVGSLNNPQKRIVGSRLLIRTGAAGGASSIIDGSVLQLQLLTAVQFIDIPEGEPEEFVPAPPPLIPPLPSDFFYPFLLPNRASVNGASLTITTIVSLALFILLL